MLLRDLIPDILPLEIRGNLDREIGELVFDSRKAGEGSVFVAVRGTQSDGHQYIGQAVRSGAAAVVAETMPDTLSLEVTYIRVANSAEALGFMAHRFFDRPSEALKLVGVTGTNGKTTTVTLLHQLFSNLGYKCGLISTVENRIGERVLPSAYTTPDAVSINRLLSEMADA
ncbi:MAG: UDP-N-acetylmuramoyl-L-alanyl-D-glutamate--2,6-diaminopimelate ligase, partial [Haliscomenobacter sp.]|nr:UDP-N-acetylmuramoyl-L-alanyl-D-glutamate--2,6-diaminopimelate ligase [Haliscomenobacter sp.]